MSIIKTEVSIDVSGIEQKLDEVTHDDDVMTLIHAYYAKILEPYVPYDTGYLSGQSVEISAEGVTYTADYAWKQYYGTEFRHKRDVHPLATALWDKVAMQTQQDVFAEQVKEILIRRMNDGQE